MIAALVTALQAAPATPPMMVVRPGALSAPLPATSWSCNFTGADGRSFVLDGRFEEIPAGAEPEEFRPVAVKAISADQFERPMRFKSGRFTADIRDYTMRADQPDGSGHTFNFQFLRNSGSFAVVSNYTPPAGDRIGVVKAYANGYCSSRFHAVGETERPQ